MKKHGIESVLRFWPILVAIFMCVAGYIRLNVQMEQYADQASGWKNRTDSQREHRSAEMEAVRTRLTRLEAWREHSERR